MTIGFTLIGTSADNSIGGTIFDDTISAGAGNDTVFGGNGARLERNHDGIGINRLGVGRHTNGLHGAHA